jgi:uncharacterized membrane protein
MVPFKENHLKIRVINYIIIRKIHLNCKFISSFRAFQKRFYADCSTITIVKLLNDVVYVLVHDAYIRWLVYPIRTHFFSIDIYRRILVWF